jgi:N-acetylmuramoyl-L-alanine amidase
MKFGIDIGHNCPPDSGAEGIKSENKLTMEVGNKVIAKLENLGHTVIACKPNSARTVNQSLGSRCEKANSNRVDIFVSIHFNAFNGQANGTEVFAISDAGKKVAQKVLDEISDEETPIEEVKKIVQPKTISQPTISKHQIKEIPISNNPRFFFI